MCSLQCFWLLQPWLTPNVTLLCSSVCVCTCLFMLDNPCTNFNFLRTFPKWNNSHYARLLWLNTSPLNNQLYAIQLLMSPVLLFSLIAGGHGLDEGWAGLALAVAAPITDWWIDCSIAASESVPWARAPRLREGIPAMAPAMVPLLWAACRGPLGLATQGAALTHILLSRPWRHTLWGQAGRCVGFATE